jgi:outer membrane immunogenic protein
MMTLLAAVLAAVLVAMLPGAARADSPDWSGFYIGAHAGHDWAAWDGTIETTAGCTGTCPTAGYDDPTHTLDGRGWLGGGQAGINLQSGAFVYGIEADISGGDLDARGRFATDRYNPWVWDKSFHTSIDYFGTLRLRAGLATGPVLPYLTGGLAWARTSADLAVAQSHLPDVVDGVSHASVHEDHLGWTIGTGIEWKLASNVSLKAEYLYMDLGRERYLFKGTTFTDAPFATDSFPADLTVHVLRVGVNYKLN